MTDDELATWAAKLLGIEQSTEQDVSAIFQPMLSHWLGLLVSEWPGDDAPLADQQAVLERLNVDALNEAVPRVRAAIKKGARVALSHGIDVARKEVDAAGGDVPEELPPALKHLSPELHGRVDALTPLIRTKVAKANILLRHSTTKDDAMAALAVAQSGINIVKAVARHATNDASNEAITTVSHSVDNVVSIWRSERDACVDCLAYQGEIDSGDGYPSGLTFGSKPNHTGDVAKPPLHPNCRCTQSIVHKDTAQGFAQTLKREAQRSVLRGWSRPSESETTRVEAAKRLLKRDPNMPKSVKDYARRAVTAGGFSKGRTPPA